MIVVMTSPSVSSVMCLWLIQAIFRRSVPCTESIPYPDSQRAICCHAFRAIDITDYLTSGGRLEVAQRMAGHANAKTIGLYDRRNDDISLSDVERIGI